MIRTILVPLDGSAFAEHALPLAMSVAERCKTTLRLLRIVPPLADQFFLPPLPTDPLSKELRSMFRTEALDYLDDVVRRMKYAGSVTYDVIEEEEGISESVCADVVRNGVDLIAMSSHGRGAVARFWLGSNADKLIRTAPVPVLLARPPEHLPAADLQRHVNLKHLLIALGGSVNAGSIVEPALAIGKASGARYTLVRVVRPAHAGPRGAAGKPPSSATWSELEKIDKENCKKAEEYLHTVAARLQAEGATVQTRVHVAEQPAAAILREAEVTGADLIALETHGRGVSRLLIGSVADKVVRGSSLPVLVCRLPSASP